jgi:hypothetical protein
MDELFLFNRTLSDETIKRLYAHGPTFSGTYVSEVISAPSSRQWENLEVNATLPSNTSLSAEIRSPDTGESQSLNLTDGEQTYPLSLSGQNLTIRFLGTSSSVERSWRIHDWRVIS